ncbi:Ileal sodium/bile acid cotransporter [Portunus trituberculatus]|uniref:Ileal sodium/bile acid cotransporter n=1 Tax=Portunus trituberculatus TaxID=210409 RepID=A0A5B7HFG0_PORTR|nr:Ileal sodium/bile acid cotransporter [Portunus trituberculatus]
MRLGMFLSGCCPGGGASNMWTHLLGGSLDLSCMMTCVSTFVSFASVPLWVLTLGPVIMSDADFIIPYEDITITVISLILPCGLGIILQAKFKGCQSQEKGQNDRIKLEYKCLET